MRFAISNRPRLSAAARWTCAALLAFALLPSPASAEYRACRGEASMRSAPDFGAARIGNVPADAPVDMIYEYDLWVLVSHEGREGWATAASVCRPGGEAGIQMLHARTEKVKGGYRHHFGFFNSTEGIFAGKIRLEIYNAREAIFSEEYDFALDYIPGNTGRAFTVETDLDMTGYRFDVTSDNAMPLLLP